jgi:hypothetical protein
VNIGLYDVDSKIPNLALMKLSAWHKAEGDRVEFCDPISRFMFDKIYASKIFTFSEGGYLTAEMVIGGSGSGTDAVLPPEIEAMKPDYDLYNIDYSVGFTSRGCRFQCKFCIVPDKEGGVKHDRTIPEIGINPRSNKILLLDNDFLGNPEWKARLSEMEGYRVSIFQGLNFRKMTEEQAAAITKAPLYVKSFDRRGIYTAWDTMKDESRFFRGFNRLREAGYKGRIIVYVLVGFKTTAEEDLYRVEKLREIAEPYVMTLNPSNFYQKEFARWVNHKGIFKTIPWHMYKRSRGLTDQVIRTGTFHFELSVGDKL